VEKFLREKVKAREKGEGRGNEKKERGNYFLLLFLITINILSIRLTTI